MGSATTGGAVTGGGAVSVSPTPTGGDGHSHSNKELLDRLQGEEGGGYLYERVYNESGGEDGEGAYESRKVKAGWADGAGQAEDSEKWNGVEMSEMLDQPVRRGDAVEFGGLNCAGELEGKILRVTEAAEVGGAVEVGGDATMNGNATVNGNAEVTGDMTGSKLTARSGVVAPRVTSSDFNASAEAIGAGYGLTTDGGMSKLTIDNIVVRNKMTVASLVIQEYKSVGGVLALSRAHGEIETVHEWSAGNGYDVYIKDFDKYPKFVKGDYARCARWDKEINDYVSYCVPVMAVATNAQGIECLNLLTSYFPVGVVPQAGDQLVQWGHKDDSDRQGLIIISVEEGTPRIDAYDGIKGEVLPLDKLKARLGRLDGITDNGKALRGYGLWTNNLYIGTGKSIIDTFKEVVAQIDSIAVGGRNLLTGSSRVMEDRSILVGSYALTQNNPPRNGEMVTLSFSGYIGEGHGLIRIYNSGWVVYMASITEADFNESTKRYEVTFQWKQVDDANQGTFINIFQYDTQGNRIDAGDYLNDERVASRIYNVLLERSSKASADWYPAPEDYDEMLAVYKEEVSAQFDVVNGAMTSVQQSVKSLQTGGGRNLLLQTNQGVTGWWFWSGAIVPYITAYRSGVMIENSNLAEAVAVFRFPLRPERMVAGRQYILTVDVTLSPESVESGQRFYLNIMKPDGTASLLSASVYADKPLSLGLPVTLSFPFAPITSGTANGGQVVYLGLPASKWTSVIFENLKLEEGTVATAYSPAPEDYIDGEIADVRTSITAIEQTTESITARVEEVNSSLNGKIATNTASITANANAITSEVKARTEGDEQLSSRITQTADSISMKVSELGLSNVNHALGTALPWVQRMEFLNKENEVYKLYDVTGLASGDKISFSCVLRFKGLVWGAGAFISIQLSDVFGYVGLSPRITADSLSSYSIDADGYYNIKLQATAKVVGKNTTIGTDAVATDVGFAYIRLDYISSATDDLGVSHGYISVSQMKIEIGDNVTPWTARTADLEQAIADTGIDISNRRITATADNFVVLNNNGEMTAHVDANGNLAVGSIACRYTDGQATTPFVADWNTSADGIQRWYYPNGVIRAEVGWDDATESFIRKYNTDGDLLWKLGDPSEFQTYSEPIWVAVSLYYCGAAFSSVPKTETSLPGTTYYRKTNTGNADTNNVVYKNSVGAIPEVIDDGWYTDPGRPFVVLDQTAPGLEARTRYTRKAYHYVAGKLIETITVTWATDTGAV